jgi:NitT/TauT family transport system ATP-binding protein
VFAITNRAARLAVSVVERDSLPPEGATQEGELELRDSPRDSKRGGTSVVLDKVTVAYGRERDRSGANANVALTNVSLRVSAGEFVCILGPSGSGKSSILNVVAGLVAPAAGSVSAGGKVVRGPSPERAVVFQDAALFPWLTLRKNIEFPLGVQGVSEKERAERSERLLRLVHLWKFRDSHPHELSGGMRQRGAIARALATDPNVLLMDEPFAALDAQTREILHGELERIWTATRKTVLFVTHNVREAVRLADRVILLGTRPGRVLEERTIDLPRPRGENDEAVARVAGEIGRRIASEVEKVASEEADDARDYANDRVRRPDDRAVGARH